MITVFLLDWPWCLPPVCSFANTKWRNFCTKKRVIFPGLMMCGMILVVAWALYIKNRSVKHRHHEHYHLHFSGSGSSSGHWQSGFGGGTVGSLTTVAARLVLRIRLTNSGSLVWSGRLDLNDLASLVRVEFDVADGRKKKTNISRSDCGTKDSVQSTDLCGRKKKT